MDKDVLVDTTESKINFAKIIIELYPIYFDTQDIDFICSKISSVWKNLRGEYSIHISKTETAVVTGYLLGEKDYMDLVSSCFYHKTVKLLFKRINEGHIDLFCDENGKITAKLTKKGYREL